MDSQGLLQRALNGIVIFTTLLIAGDAICAADDTNESDNNHQPIRATTPIEHVVVVIGDESHF